MQQDATPSQPGNGDATTTVTAADEVDRQLEALPDPAWLDEVEAELADVEAVLSCLARDTAVRCDTCADLARANQLEARPALARCAADKEQPAG